MNLGEFAAKMFGAMFTGVDNEVFVEVDGKVLPIEGNFRTENGKFILQVPQEKVEEDDEPGLKEAMDRHPAGRQQMLPKQMLPKQGPHPVGGYKLHENDWNGPQA